MTIRLEMKDKGSSKFWEAEVQGTALVTRWGRIGSDGQTLKKKHDNEWAAKTAMQSQVQEKLSKGYKRAKTARELELERPPERAAARNPDLERKILEHLDDPEPWLVYADWLQGEGDPRGELIVVQHALEGRKDRKLAAQEKKLLEQHAALLLGPLRKWDQSLDGRDREVFTWRRGFLHGVRLSFDVYADETRGVIDLPRILEDIVAHPSGALLQEIVIGLYNTGKWDSKRQSSQVYQPLLDVIARARPPALRRLVIGDYEFPDDTEISWTHIGSLAKIWKACPRLERLRLQGGGIQLGTIEAPRLREAAFVTGGLPREALKSIARASWPNLERLEVWFGADEYGAGGKLEDVRPILDGKGLPKLKHLALKNGELQDELAAALGTAKIVEQLETLDLSMGVLTAQGAQALARHAASFKHLTLLDVSDSYLGPAGLKAVKGLAKKVNVAEQRDADEDDGEIYRYTSVGE